MDIWIEKWVEDLEFLRETLMNNHINLFFNTSKESFYSSIENLKREVSNLDYDEMKVEISRIVASIGDAHTAVAFPVNTFLPISFYQFKDGIYIMKVKEGMEDLLYRKVEEIEGIKIEEVLEELSKIVSHENKYFLKSQAMKYLQAVDVLYGLYICDDKEKIRIVVEGKEVILESISASELSYVENNNIPLYAKKSNCNYWYEIIKEELYIKYNSCREDGIKLIDEKIKETIEFINKRNITKVTIDLRNNLGGDSTLLEPLIEFIRGSSNINLKDNLKVIIGRETFSSALLNAYQFKLYTNAEIIGEPSGGKPNCYGEILRFTLPNSKFKVSYSTRYYKLIEDDTVMALYPDRYIYESVEDYKKV